MPFDQEIEDRIQKLISGWKHTEAKKMFGGICHLIHGNMFGGVHKEFIILRLGVEASNKAWERNPHVRPFDITGRPMKGWIMVEKAGFETDKELTRWLEIAGTLHSPFPQNK